MRGKHTSWTAEYVDYVGWKIVGPADPETGARERIANAIGDEGHAHLIAAAPDLLEAAKAHLAARAALKDAPLEKLGPDDPRFTAVIETLSQIEAAIAKAEGRT